MSVVYLAEHGGLRRKVALNDLGVSWSDRVAISNGGDNYFPTIAGDSEGTGSSPRCSRTSSTGTSATGATSTSCA